MIDLSSTPSGTPALPPPVGSELPPIGPGTPIPAEDIERLLRAIEGHLGAEEDYGETLALLLAYRH